MLVAPTCAIDVRKISDSDRRRRLAIRVVALAALARAAHLAPSTVDGTQAPYLHLCPWLRAYARASEAPAVCYTCVGVCGRGGHNEMMLACVGIRSNQMQCDSDLRMVLCSTRLRR